MTMTVRTINLMGFVFYLALIGWFSTLGVPDKLHLSTVLMLTPIPYFLVCIATSFARRQGKGAAVHLRMLMIRYLIGHLPRSGVMQRRRRAKPAVAGTNA